jgi:hypothetical protein
VTTPLRALAKTVEVGVERFRRRDELITQIRGLDAVKKATSRLETQVRELSDVARAARQAGFAPPIVDSEGVISGLAKLRDQLGRGAFDRESAQVALDALQKLVHRANDAIAAGWRQYVVSRLPTPEGLLELARTFIQVEGASTHAQRLRIAAIAVQRVVQQRPTREAVTRLDALSQEIPELLQYLVGEDVEVREFADQLARGGAGIDTLTPAVVEWMHDKGFTNSFKILPGPPASPTRGDEHR